MKRHTLDETFELLKAGRMRHISGILIHDLQYNCHVPTCKELAVDYEWAITKTYKLRQNSQVHSGSGSGGSLCLLIKVFI